MINIKHETLIQVLSKMLYTSIISATYETTQLQGGTLADVQLVIGVATTADDNDIPYKIVLKTQKKWDRPGDPNSWRREYDLYTSDFTKSFTESFSMPQCYHAEMMDNEIQIWMEYVDGVSGEDLSIEMLEQAAYKLGCFQAGNSNKSSDFMNLTCLNDAGYLEREFSQWHRQTYTYEMLTSESCPIPSFLKQLLKDGDLQLVEGKSFEYSYLRSRGCDIPDHLKQMLIDIDDRQDEIFDKIKNLPIVLCHRDFWHENIFYYEDNISLIDWDTTGWGFLGEDIASLIVDDMPVERIEENYARLVPAYRKGLSESMDISSIIDMYILDMILIKFGYRMMQEYMFSESKEEDFWGIQALQKIYEMRNANGK